MTMVRRNSVVWLGYFMVWLLLAGLATFVAWQAHVTTLYLTALLIDHPTWRPPGWNSGTLVAVSKLSVVGWGALWVMTTFYMEYQLRESTYERRLRQQWARFLLLLLIGLTVFYLPFLL
jgi:hypothetical protein